jgi:rRNA maturation protein Nop10
MHSAECPYCGARIKVDSVEYEEWEETCSSCGEDFEVSVEYSPELHTRKYNFCRCIICDSKFDKTWSSRHPMPEPYKSTDDICYECFCNLSRKERL